MDRTMSHICITKASELNTTVMGKLNKCVVESSEMELKKGPWTREEDQKLLAYIQEHGHGSWRTLPVKAGLERCGKSCRMRWTNYLRPDIKRGKFSIQEEKTIIRLHALLGNRWSAISAHLPKRTDNEIKNYWNTRLKKRLTRMGIDPVTHKPKSNSSSSQAANLSHMAQWETARLEAESRLVHNSKILYNIQLLRKSRVPPPPPPQPPRPQCLDVLKVWQANNTPNTFFRSGTSVPTVGGSSFIPNNGMLGKVDYVAEKGKMGISIPANDDNIANTLDYNLSGLTDFMSINNHVSSDIYDIASELVGHLDDEMNYWSELLDLVSSPMLEPPTF